MRLSTRALFAIATVLFASCATTRPQPNIASRADSGFTLSDTLPLDPLMTVGTLENGVTYYIRVNRKPENRAELRLVVNAGSILEDDDQQGLAHFTEHMAFNGTEHFAKQELVDYLELIGMRSGPDINAYTSFDETVYMLQVPTDSAALVERAFLILEDWAHGMTMEDDEIDKERGVIKEEWRLRRGAEARMRDKQYPIIFKDSRYAERLPIGKMAVVDTSHCETLRRFYRAWYRPELMAVIAVGDFDENWIEELIKAHFSNLSSVDDPHARELFLVPDHDSTLFAIATDPEATRSRVAVMFKHDVRPYVTGHGYRQRLIEGLYHGMFNDRLEELTKKSDPPFLYAHSGNNRVVRSKEAYRLLAGVREDGIALGLETLLIESSRIQRFGFTETELERQKRKAIRSAERAYAERDKTKSRRFARQYVSNYLLDHPISGIDFTYRFRQQYLPTITLDEVNDLATQWISEENRVVLVNSPEKEDGSVPTAKELARVIDSVEKEVITAYIDSLPGTALLETLPTPGSVVEEIRREQLGVTEWVLSNGVRVILKPTDFKNDQVLFTSFSLGGHSLATDRTHIASRAASGVIEEGGVGDYSKTDLSKLLAGKVVQVIPIIGELTERISGSCSPRDMETMFQLVYLYFTAPRKDSTAFLAYRARLESFVEDRSRSPEAVFYDSVATTLSQHHFRRRPWSEALLDELDLGTSYDFFSHRFADASDFTFIFVGNLSLEQVRPLIETYLGGLPSSDRRETWRDVGVTPPLGIIDKTVRKGLEKKSLVFIAFTGPFQWNRQNRYWLDSMTSALRLELRESIREDLGGSYDVSVQSSPTHYPEQRYTTTIRFGCDPDRVDELVGTVFNRIDSLKTFGPDDVDTAKIKQMQRRKRERDLKENRFWQNQLYSAYYHSEPPEEMLRYDQLIESLTVDDIIQSARKHLDASNYVKVVLYPES